MLRKILYFIVGTDEIYSRTVDDIVSKNCKLLRIFWWKFVPLFFSNHYLLGKCSTLEVKNNGSMRISRLSARLCSDRGLRIHQCH
jgi:hypothetical protein